MKRVPRRQADPRWQELFEQLDRIEQHQADLTSALWAEVHRRLDRIERQQAELQKVALDLAGSLGSVGERAGLALGSPIDPLPIPSLAPEARPDMGLPPFARAVHEDANRPAEPDAAAGAPPPAEDEAVPVAPEEAAGEARLLPPVWAPDPDPHAEPPWLAAPLPAAFVSPRPIGRRRWFFGRRRDGVPAPDLFWPPSGAAGPSAPPPAPGFVWAGSAPAPPEADAVAPSPTAPAEHPSAATASAGGRPGSRGQER